MTCQSLFCRVQFYRLRPVKVMLLAITFSYPCEISVGMITNYYKWMYVRVTIIDKNLYVFCELKKGSWSFQINQIYSKFLALSSAVQFWISPVPVGEVANFLVLPGGIFERYCARIVTF